MSFGKCNPGFTVYSAYVLKFPHLLKSNSQENVCDGKIHLSDAEQQRFSVLCIMILRQKHSMLKYSCKNTSILTIKKQDRRNTQEGI